MTVVAKHQHWAEEFQHEALFYAGLDDFLSGTVPFLREGLERDEAMLVAVPGPRLRALRAELRSELENSSLPVTFLDMVEIGHNPPTSSRPGRSSCATTAWVHPRARHR